MTNDRTSDRCAAPARGFQLFLWSTSFLAVAQIAAPQAAAQAALAPRAQAESSGAIDATALRSAASDDRTRGFYEANGWKPVWTDSARQALRRALDARVRHGLDRVAFLDGAPGDGAAGEVAQTRAALRYAEALAMGKTNPEELHSVYTLPRPQVDVSTQLAQAIAHGRVEQWLGGLAPQGEEYRRLSAAYGELAGRGEGQEPSIPDTGLIHVGDSDPRVPEIAAALRSSEYLGVGEAAAERESQRYTQRIADAVEKLQRDYGIAEDGVVGPDTLQVLNLGPGDRARALAVAMERMRWLSRTPPARRIDVNTAAAQLRYYRDGKVVDTRRVIVGQPGKETPLLRSPIYRLVANPTWTVPKSIENSELAGLSAGQLAARNMERRGGWIVEQSGPDNALGLVKFDMRNQHAIYLHDTNARALLDRSQRHLSHGCVRVEDALGFARRIAEEEGVLDEWEKARDTGSETFVDLPEEIPVRLIYRNVFVDRSGAIAYRTDPYGWNGPIAEALGFAKRASKQARTEEVDVGP